MGLILSPINGASVYQGAVVPVQYFSDLVDFDCGVSTGICFIDYKINGNLEVGAVPITQPGFAPQQQADQPLTMPLTGSTVTIDVEGRSIGGQLNDTATVTLNLLPPPLVSCNPSSSPTSTSLGLSGLISSANNDVCIFRYGTTSGGPYNAGSVGPFFIDGSSIAPSGTATGLTPDTTYFYVLEFVDDYGNVIATSGECSGQTLVAPPTAACTGPAPINFTSINLAGTLSGNLPAGGSSRFRYGTNPGGPYPNTMVAAPYAVGSVGQTVTGLPPGTTYYFVLDILDSANTVVATSGECSTSTMAATASCAAPTGITASGMTLNGSINFAPVGGSVRFRYGTTSGGPYATTVAGSPFAGGPISANITGLAASTQYYYIVETLDSTSTVIATSTQCTGTTLAAATPTASCAAATSITTNSMTFNGTIGNIPAGGSVRFRYGTASGGPYGTAIAAGPYANGAVNASPGGLTPNTQYYYILEVLNSSGVVVATSTQCTATTLAVPSATCSAATNVAQTTATLNGTVGGIPVGGSIRFRYGNTNGGPYGTTVAAAPYANGNVSANITGLTGGAVTYYILEVLNSANTVVATSGQCLLTTVSDVCSTPTAITSTGMTLNGTIANIPAGGSARFRYGTVSGGPYGTTVAATPYAQGNVSAVLTGLTPSTTYYFVLEILNASSTVVATSLECNGATAAAPAAPVATCGGTAALGQTTATLQGNINNIPVGGSVRFRYGTTLNGPYPSTVAATPYANGGVTGNVTGLTPGTPYHYITEVLNSSNVVVATSSDCSFTTLGVPSAVCSAATAIATTSMTFNGSLGGSLPAGGLARFVYSTTSGGPYNGVSLALPYAVGAVSANITGLTPGTTYYYVLEMVDSSSVVQALSIECSASTAALPVVPAATCAAATGVAQTAATLNGTLANIPAGGSAVFRYGTTNGGPYTLNAAAAPYANGNTSANVTGLTAGTTYYYRLEILNSSSAIVATSPQCSFATQVSPVASATCASASGVTQTAMTLNGTLANVPAGGSARFRYGTVNGGPYGTTVAAAPYANGAVTANVTGLTANTTYYSILEILNSSNTIVATSAQCSQVTSAVGQPCPIPAGVSKCPPITVYSVGGTEYVAFGRCDSANNQQVLAVFQMCNGVPSGAPSVFDMQGNTYTLLGQLVDCATNSNNSDYEQHILCDNSVNPPKPFVSRVAFNSDGDLIPDLTGTFELDGTTPYTPVGPIAVCGGDTADIEFQGPLCEKDPSGQIVGQVWHKIIHRGTVQISDTLAGYRTSNPSVWVEPYTITAGNTLEACFDVASRDCTPSSDVVLSQTNCVGSPVPAGVLGALSPASVNSDEPAFDGLCTSSVASAPESYAAPFPVNEPLRGATSGMTLFGNAVLTASAAGGNVDPSGAGWLRLTQDAPGQAGVAIINAAFPSTTAIDFEYSFATYTNTGGEQFCGPDAADGHVLMLLDGNQPIPAAPGASGGALGYSWNNVGGQVGIAAGVLGIGVHEFATYSQSGFVGQGGISAAGVNNAITVRGAGNSGAANSATYSWLATQLLPSGRTVGRHPRTAPVKVRGSLQPSGAQMILNVTMDFGTGYEPVITNLLINQTMPTNLRIGLGAATGGCWNAHEIRDLVIAPAARRRWRTIAPSYAAPPACATLLQATAQMKYTITSDTQAVQGGDNDDEHFVGWAIENPPGTYSWLSQKWIKSAPVDVGVERTLTLNSGSIANLADLPNLRLVVGAETVDLRGSYGVRFSDLSISVVASGCPVQTIKTLPISSPCPLPVVVSGSNGAVSATVNTVDVQIVCSDLGQLFRREINDTSGTPKITFISQDGAVVSPTSWTPGPCSDCDCEKLVQPGCVTNSAGATTTVAVIYSFTAAGVVDTAATKIIDKNGATVTLASGDTLNLGECVSSVVKIPCFTCRS